LIELPIAKTALSAIRPYTENSDYAKIIEGGVSKKQLGEVGALYIIFPLFQALFARLRVILSMIFSFLILGFGSPGP
jgi:hypothetical protein